MHGDSLVWLYVGIMGLALMVALAYQLTPGARLRRRRRKSHGPILTKGSRPMVRFSVKTKRKK